jgi:K+-transporting ATPase KdpF subunit
VLPNESDIPMENIIALIVSVAVSVYLLCALLRPERF